MAICSVPHFPDEDTKQRATALAVRRGGNCPNSLEVLAQLMAAGPQRRLVSDVKLHLVTCLPDAQAPATGKILASFGDGGGVIDFDHCLFRVGHQEPASSYIIRSKATGSRTIVNYNELPEMMASEFQAVADAFARQGSGGGDGGDAWWWHFEVRKDKTKKDGLTPLPAGVTRWEERKEVAGKSRLRHAR